MPQPILFKLRDPWIAKPFAPLIPTSGHTLPPPFADTFDDNSQDPSWINNFPLVNTAYGVSGVLTFAETNQRVEGSNSGASGAVIANGWTQPASDRLGLRTFLKVSNLTTLGKNAVVILSVGPGRQNLYSIYLESGGVSAGVANMYAVRTINGGETVIGSLAFTSDAVTISVRHDNSSDTIYLEYALSTVGNNPPLDSDYTVLASESRNAAVDLTAAYQGFVLGNFGATTAHTIYFDGFNAAANGSVANDNGTASGSLPLTGSATGTVKVQGSSTGSLPLTGSGTGKVKVQGVATGSIRLTGSAAGRVKVQAAAAGALPLTGSAAVTHPVKASGSGTLPLTGAAAGTHPVKAVGSGSLPLTGTAAGAVKLAGAAAGTLPLSGTGTGKIALHGASVGLLALSGASTAAISIHAVASGLLPLSGSASSSSNHVGAAQGTIAFSGSASAQVKIKGTAQQTLAFSGSAAALVDVRGAASSGLTFTGVAAGAVRIKGVANDNLALIGSASGRTGQPSVAPADRTATVERSSREDGVSHETRIGTAEARSRTGTASRDARIGSVGRSGRAG